MCFPVVIGPARLHSAFGKDAMKNATTYYGWVGVGIALLLSFAALCASLSPVHEQVGAVWYVATYPVSKAWEAFLRTLEGDRGMMFILPMLATQLLFVLVVGFGVGALLGRSLGSRGAEPGASPNGGPAGRLGNSGLGGRPPSVS